MSETATDNSSSTVARVAAIAPAVKTQVARIPIVGRYGARMSHLVRRLVYPGSTTFWEQAYSRGGTSGPGSYGALADFKAEVVNGFLTEHSVQSAIEFGCGDGNQLGLMHYPSYIGLDVSKVAIQRCKDRFIGDETKSFFLYDSECFVDRASIFSADLALSLDVIFHLTEDHVYSNYMHHLFQAARRFVIVYSSNSEDATTEKIPCVRHRNFSDWVESNRPEWELVGQVTNPMKYPAQADGSFSDFYFYRRRSEA